MQEMYSIKEVAEILKVSTKTVYKHIWSGKLKALKAGRQYRITKEALEDYLNSNGK